jgi:hypothetical protein
MNLISKSIRLILILSVFLAVPLQSVLNASHTKHPPQIVMGTIEEVTYSSIRIDGKYYDISHAVILSVRGIPLTKDQLKPGGKVEIRIEENAVTSIIVKTKYYDMQ